MKIHASSPPMWAGALVLLAAALLYGFTLDNGFRPDELLGGDLITHQYAQVEGRPSNAPGYPLYVMGGWLWFHAARPLLSPLFNPIQVLSFYSALWGLASLAMLYLILLRVTANRWAIAALLTAFHATTYFFWYYSVTTEQYSSATFQSLLLIWLALKWDDSPRDATLLWMAFVSGTMLANMLTTLFILPPLLWFILFKQGDDHRWRLTGYLRRPGLVLQAIGAAMLPLLAYAYVFIRGAQHPEWRGQGQWPSAWAWFVDFMTIQQGRDELAPGLSLQNIFTAEFPALMWHELTLPVFVGGLLGLAFLGRRRAIFFYSTLIIYFFFCWGYRFGNWFQVIIPAYPIFTIGFGALLARLAVWAERGPQQLRPLVQPAIALFLAGLIIFSVAGNFSRATQRNRPTDTALTPGWAILADGPQPPALIATGFEERLALQYLASVWVAAPGLSAVDAAAWHGGTTAGHNLYISRTGAAAAPHLINSGRYFPQAAGRQLIELRPAARAQLPARAQPVRLNFGDGLSLVGWELPPAETWQLALYWQSDGPIGADYTVSVRPLVGGQPVTAAGEPVIQDHQPVWGLYPTSRWRPAEMVRDVYALNLPAGVTPDAVQIVVYRATATGFENLAEHSLTLTP